MQCRENWNKTHECLFLSLSNALCRHRPGLLANYAGLGGYEACVDRRRYARNWIPYYEGGLGKEDQWNVVSEKHGIMNLTLLTERGEYLIHLEVSII